MPKAVVITHGGAGGPRIHDDVCKVAAHVGIEVLGQGLGSLEAVIRATEILEDDPRLNAGTGSNFRLDGKTIEMDAAVMNYDRKFGAVAGLRDVQYPVRVAEQVLETPHLFLAGEGANRFARNRGFPEYDPSSERARERYKRVLAFLRGQDETLNVKHWEGIDPEPLWNYPGSLNEKLKNLAGPSDTVGAVARDKDGKCAAALSTGGTSVMLFGRVGDTPLVGCGLYAGPHGAVACTGDGEEIMRVVMAKQAYDWMAEGKSPQEACDQALALVSKDYVVGLIAISTSDEGAADNRTMPQAREYLE